ncbi:SDR family NAD(P)-dependent oxidoreductase [Micromonospora sp. DT44]|uniref:SDR family NAD(P)-dependent oxidoreductase n=1 Tax=Micromonospora sp. DT44 TaxID=3393439 RepID=UPI003CEEDBC7
MSSALVVGGRRGLGREVAEQLEQAGWSVLRTGRSRADLESADGRARDYEPLDLRDDSSVARLAHAQASRGRTLDLLMISAGSASLGGMTELEPTTFLTMLDEHVVGTYRLVRQFRPQLAAANGHVIVVLSRMGSRPRPHGYGYGTAKAASGFLTQCLAMELEPDGIRFNYVSPGAMDTDMFRTAFPGRDPATALDVGDVARTIVALTTPEFHHLSGAVIEIPRPR